MFLGDFAFGDFTPYGEYAFEAVTGTEWGEWDALPGENPDDCLRSQNADHITQISNVITDRRYHRRCDHRRCDHRSARPRTALSSASTTCRRRSSRRHHQGAVTNNGPAKVFATFESVTKGL